MSVGSELTAARERVGLTIEELSAATRIRPGLLTAMEADDFSRCGGNFYARGHLRSIARVLKADPAPLLATFDETLAAPEVDRSRREERADARLPTLHPARPRWAVVLGAILVGLMGWGMVRLFTLPSDVEATAVPTSPTPVVTTPAPVKPAPPKPTVVKPPPVPTTPPVPKLLKLTLKAQGEGSYVTLRNYDKDRLFQGLLGPDASQTITYPGSIRVSLGIPSNVTLLVNGRRVDPESRRFMITIRGAVDREN